MNRSALVAAAFAAATVAAVAPAAAQPHPYGPVAAAGFGAWFGVRPEPTTGLRIETNMWRGSARLDETDVDYARPLRFRQVALFGDWFPFEGGLRVATGLVVTPYVGIGLRFQDEADRFSIYPVARTGLVYRF
jgi:hypothetical protein